MGITKFRVMATNELNSTGLIIYTEAENLHWVQYILDEFCRIEKAKFFIKVKNYNRQLKKNDNAIYYLEGVKSDIFQVQKREFFKNNNIEIIFNDFKHPIYEQIHGNFVKDLSILDIILNCGITETEKLIKNA